jgi:hypothetical protein
MAIFERWFGGTRRAAQVVTAQGTHSASYPGRSHSRDRQSIRFQRDLDSYDLSWYDDLPGDYVAAVQKPRLLLRDNPDPIDRHFMFCELERKLYHSRDAFDSALDQYDEVCRQHDAEMDVIRAALFTKFQVVPLLETYTQMAIRQQKAGNWRNALLVGESRYRRLRLERCSSRGGGGPGKACRGLYPQDARRG